MSKYLLYDKRNEGYPFGVMAYPLNPMHGAELHGPFATRDKAEAHVRGLREEFSDYVAIVVVKIETPVANKEDR